MTHDKFSLCVLLILGSCGILSAGESEIASSLPEPGTWMKYFVEDITATEETKLDPEEITIKILKEETIGDEQFVRIESVLEPLHKRHVSKCLLVIRKQSLLTGNLRKRDVKLLRSKLATLPARDDTAEISDPLYLPEIIVTVLLAGGLSHWKDARMEETEKPVTVDWQRGRSTSRTKVSVHRPISTEGDEERTRLTLTNDLFADSPNSVLQASVTQEESNLNPDSKEWSEYKSVGTWKLTLMDFGAGVEETLKD